MNYKPQVWRVLDALKLRPQTTLSLRELHNVMAPAARIAELKRAGFEITVVYVSLRDMKGVLHHKVACYTLQGSRQLSLMLATNDEQY